MHEDSLSETYLKWVTAERLAQKASADFLDRAVWPDSSTMPDHFPSGDVVAVLRAEANECFKAAMAELEQRAADAVQRSIDAQIKLDNALAKQAELSSKSTR